MCKSEIRYYSDSYSTVGYKLIEIAMEKCQASVSVALALAVALCFLPGAFSVSGEQCNTCEQGNKHFDGDSWEPESICQKTFGYHQNLVIIVLVACIVIFGIHARNLLGALLMQTETTTRNSKQAMDDQQKVLLTQCEDYKRKIEALEKRCKALEDSGKWFWQK